VNHDGATHIFATELLGGTLRLELKLEGALGGHVREARFGCQTLGLNPSQLGLPLGLLALWAAGCEGRGV
jgi:hypothetical protein